MYYYMTILLYSKNDVLKKNWQELYMALPHLERRLLSLLPLDLVRSQPTKYFLYAYAGLEERESSSVSRERILLSIEKACSLHSMNDATNRFVNVETGKAMFQRTKKKLLRCLHQQTS